MNIDLYTGQPTNENYITESFKSTFNTDDVEKNNSQKKDFDLRGFY
jgi:hypothetical protein